MICADFGSILIPSMNWNCFGKFLFFIILLGIKLYTIIHRITAGAIYIKNGAVSTKNAARRRCFGVWPAAQHSAMMKLTTAKIVMAISSCAQLEPSMAGMDMKLYMMNGPQSICVNFECLVLYCRTLYVCFDQLVILL